MADRELPLADMGPLNPPPHKMTGLTEGAIYQAIRRYGVRSHYRATSADKRTRYAVFSNGKVASAPMSHAEARANILADMINAGGDDQWNRLDRDALSQWRRA